MKVSKLLAVLFISVFLSQSIFAQAKSQQMLMPSEALYLTYKAIDNNPTGDRIKNIGHLMPRLITENLKVDELFFLGEMYFWNFKPNEAAAAYKHFLSENGSRGRAAWQRYLQIKFRAYDEHKEVEKLISDYRLKYKAIPEDRYGMFGQVYNQANLYQKKGNYKKVVEMIKDELNSLNYSGAYRSFILPAYFNKSFRELKKTSEAIELLENAIKGLKATLKKRNSKKPGKDIRYAVHTNPVERMHTVMTARLGYAQMTEKFEDLIKQLEDSVQKFRGD